MTTHLRELAKTMAMEKINARMVHMTPEQMVDLALDMAQRVYDPYINTLESEIALRESYHRPFSS